MKQKQNCLIIRFSVMQRYITIWFPEHRKNYFISRINALEHFSIEDQQLAF